MTLGALLERAALRRPDADAVSDGATRASYASLWEHAGAVARGFERLSVGKGDRVLIVLKNRVEHIVAYWALQRLGAVPVPVNFRFAAEELAYVLDDSGARAVLFEPVTRGAVTDAAGARALPRVFVGADVPPGAIPWTQLATPGEGPRPSIGDTDLSLILYTSGTTGRPKGVPRTHAHQLAGAVAHALQCRYDWGERTLGVMPLYHTMGIHSLNSMAAVNGCFACQPDWSPGGALTLIGRERLTALYLIPTLFHDLLHAPAFPTADLTSVRKLAYAGAPMSASLTQACVKAFDPDVFVNHYGSTEIYTFAVRPAVHEKPGCAGRPGLYSSLRVVTASGERRVGPDEVVAPGQKGEIIARLDSNEAFAGYWNRPDADAKALRNGWYFTGDVGYLDADGELFVSGRVDDMIISGGENIHPVEVEDVLAEHSLVRDVAVVGEPDERWGERVVAFVVAKDPTLSPEALDRHCVASPRLASFKRPRRFVFVQEIPKTASGKILRRVLRELTSEPS